MAGVKSTVLAILERTQFYEGAFVKDERSERDRHDDHDARRLLLFAVLLAGGTESGRKALNLGEIGGVKIGEDTQNVLNPLLRGEK